MKLFRFLFILIAAVQFLNAQQKLPDSLKIAWETAQNDSVRFKVSRAIYTFYEEINRDSAFHYAQLRYHLAQKYHRKIEEAYLLGQMAYQQIYLGLYSEALTNLTAAFQIITLARDAATWEITPFDTPGKSREITLSMLNHMYGHLKLQTGSKESIPYFKEGRRIGKEIGNHFRVTVADMVLSTNYLMLEDPDSALIYAQEGEIYARQGGVFKYLAYLYWVTGDIYIKKQIDSLGLNYFHKSLQLAIPEGNYSVVAGVYESLINYYKLKGNQDSLLVYASNSLAVIKSMGAITSIILSDVNLGKAYQHMADAYALKGKVDSTNKYLQLALAIKDSLTASKLARLVL